MPSYLVTVKEVWDQLVRVDANSEEDAIKRVRDGAGTYLENPEYSRTLDSDGWKVETDENYEETLDGPGR